MTRIAPHSTQPHDPTTNEATEAVDVDIDVELEQTFSQRAAAVRAAARAEAEASARSALAAQRKQLDSSAELRRLELEREAANARTGSKRTAFVAGAFTVLLGAAGVFAAVAWQPAAADVPEPLAKLAPALSETDEGTLSEHADDAPLAEEADEPEPTAEVTPEPAPRATPSQTTKTQPEPAQPAPKCDPNNWDPMNPCL